MTSTIIIEKRDLFEVPRDYALAHCISADGTMGAGIALQFVTRFPYLKEIRRKTCVVGDIVTATIEGLYIFNLVTKRYYYQKPTLDTLKSSLCAMFRLMERRGITKVAMPKIGCGLDRLDWEDVYKVLNDSLSRHETSFEVLVCVI